MAELVVSDQFFVYSTGEGFVQLFDYLFEIFHEIVQTRPALVSLGQGLDSRCLVEQTQRSDFGFDFR